MNKSHYQTIWAVVSLGCLYYALNAWIVTQGGSEVFPAKLVLSGRVPAAVLSFPICGVLLIVGSIVGIAYAGRDQTGQWHKRIPILGFKTLNTHGSRAARFYQAATLILSLVPAAAMVHFGRIILDARVSAGGQEVSIWDFAATTTVNDPARICAAIDSGQCVEGVTFFPGWQPFGYAVLSMLVLAAIVSHLGSVYAPKRMPRWLAAGLAS